MKIIDSGHSYELDQLDQNTTLGNWSSVILRFVKREGENYPGNVGKYPGTTIKEVLRACIDRLKYINNQKPAAETKISIYLLEQIILWLETRAARLHNRELDFTIDDVVSGKNKCLKCGHVGCKGHE